MSLIRQATAEDVALIAAIARSAYAKYVPRMGREPPPMRADFAAAVSAARVVVIETDGSVAGYMIAWPESDAYFIDNIAVDPTRQGGGLGRQLIGHAVAAARSLGLSALRLYTHVTMTENLAIYAHIGFVETHRGAESGFNRVQLRWEPPEAER